MCACFSHTSHTRREDKVLNSLKTNFVAWLTTFEKRETRRLRLSRTRNNFFLSKAYAPSNIAKLLPSARHDAVIAATDWSESTGTTLSRSVNQRHSSQQTAENNIPCHVPAFCRPWARPRMSLRQRKTELRSPWSCHPPTLRCIGFRLRRCARLGHERDLLPSYRLKTYMCVSRREQSRAGDQETVRRLPDIGLRHSARG